MTTETAEITAQDKAEALYKPPTSTRDLLTNERIRTGLIKLLPRGIDAARAVDLADFAVRNNASLAKCDPISIAVAVGKALSIGLDLSPLLGNCYIIPYKDKAQLQIGYKGLIKLARLSKDITSIYAYVVCEGDDFHVTLGTSPSIAHIPRYQDDAIIAAYAVVKYANGEIDFEVLSKRDLEKIRSKSKTDGSIWSEWPEEMSKKSAIRRLAKRLPMCPDEFHAAANEEKLNEQ